MKEKDGVSVTVEYYSVGDSLGEDRMQLLKQHHHFTKKYRTKVSADSQLSTKLSMLVAWSWAVSCNNSKAATEKQ